MYVQSLSQKLFVAVAAIYFHLNLNGVVVGEHETEIAPQVCSLIRVPALVDTYVTP